jgi:RNA polymerase sigma-70 factor (ECF subfamily)
MSSPLTGHIHQWYASFHVHLVKIALRWGYGEDDSRDLVQQFFLDLMQKDLEYNGVQHPQAYLSRAFSRKLVDNYRREKQQQKAAGLIDIKTYEPSILESIVEIQSNEELIAKIKNAYNTLPARCRKVIHLKFYEGLTTEQIAERTGWNARTVYNNLYEGIKALRAELNRTDPRLKFAAVFSILPIL